MPLVYNRKIYGTEGCGVGLLMEDALGKFDIFKNKNFVSLVFVQIFLLFHIFFLNLTSQEQNLTRKHRNNSNLVVIVAYYLTI